jgi:hypothetical protein
MYDTYTELVVINFQGLFSGLPVSSARIDDRLPVFIMPILTQKHPFLGLINRGR